MTDADVTDADVTDAGRDRLAAAQSALLAALLAGGPVPAGFDPERIRVQRDALLAKRRGLVARIRPDLVGPGFVAAFTGYARDNPPPEGGLRADAASFAAGWMSEPAVRVPTVRHPPVRGRSMWTSRRSTSE